jgi:hypothetical protein
VELLVSVGLSVKPDDPRIPTAAHRTLYVRSKPFEREP